MIRVALWTLAVLAPATLAAARIYERCELARELTSFGVGHDDVATWVCIAFHESRLDTAANNPYSGDHGIFQISELYWCGSGKACGSPCSSFRDGDIRDDFKCALQIHEEHTRLQGNGFLAWVVYPQNCKHNTKKYIADCDSLSKNRATNSNVRSFNTFFDNIFYSNNTRFNDNNLPSYLQVSAIFRANYGRQFDLNNKANVKWSSYKIDNIDELKLPYIGKKTETASTAVEITTPTTTTTYIPPVMPWRRIETNQFRHKPSTGIILSSTSATKALESYTEKTTTKQSTTFKPILLSTLYQLPKTMITTKRPFTGSSWTPTAKHINETSFGNKPTMKSFIFTPLTTSAPLLSKFTTSNPVLTTTTLKSNIISKTTFRSLLTSPTNKSTLANKSSTPYKFISSMPFFSSSQRTTATNAKSTTSFNYLNFAALSPTTPRSSQDKSLSSVKISSSTLRPFTTQFLPKYTIRTKFPSSTIPPVHIKSSIASPKVEVTTANPVPKITTTTQSIFNLYLNPTKQPKLSTYKLPSFNDSKFKLKIFSDGTTPSPAKDQQINQIPIRGRK